MGKVLYDIYKVKNVKSPVNGRFFGRVVPTKTMDTEGLAQHIAEHPHPVNKNGGDFIWCTGRCITGTGGVKRYTAGTEGR